MSKVSERPNGCHEWSGAKRGTMGYSSLGNEPGKLPKMVYGHVVAYEHHYGTIPQGMVVRHSCDNPICVNPLHLTVGTHSDNRGDTVERGRGGQYGRKLTADDVRKMRAMRADGASISDLVERFGLSPAQVSKICNRIQWKHI